MDRRTVIIAGLVILGFFLVVGNNKVREKILPTGNMTQKDINLPTSGPINPEPIKGRPQVEIVTTKGTITIELRPDVAPKTVNNYLSKFVNGYCENKTFHRVEDWVIQGCDPKGDGTGGESNLPTETSTEQFLAGSLGVARKAFPKEISNDSQFFIVKKDSTFLDGEYTYFGRVVSGMDIVKSIQPGDKIVTTTILTK